MVNPIHPASVLLADDSPQARRMATAYLADLGYAVTAVADGPAALAALAATPHTLALVDAALPGFPAAVLGGLELLRRIRARPDSPPLPVLLLLGALAQVDEAALATADGVLRKPLSSAGLERWLPRLASAPPTAPPAELDPGDMLRLAVREAARHPL